MGRVEIETDTSIVDQTVVDGDGRVVECPHFLPGEVLVRYHTTHMYTCTHNRQLVGLCGLVDLRLGMSGSTTWLSVAGVLSPSIVMIMHVDLPLP